MKNRFSVLASLLLLIALLACRCSRPDGPPTDNVNRPTPITPSSPSPVTPVTVTEGELRRYLTNVAAGKAGVDPLPSLSDDDWHKVESATRVRTDENGEGWLKIRGCMLIYLFQAGDLVTAPCSKAEYASGHTQCQLAGTAVYNNKCGPQAEQVVQTPTAEITPNGTWFSVTYIPQQQSTTVMVFDGSVSVKPVRNLETRALGEPITISAGQAFMTAPDERLTANKIERTVRPVSEYQYVRAVVGPWINRIQERAKQDNVEGTQALASPSPTQEITSEADIDCDCKNVSAGLLTRAYQRECTQTEANLKKQFRETQKVTGVCNSVASGPNARPK